MRSSLTAEASVAGWLTEMWEAMRAWLAAGMIPDDRELLADLTGVELRHVLREGRGAIILEKCSRP